MSFTPADNPAGIPKFEGLATDLAFGRNPIPRNPGLAMHNGDTTAGNSVEQGRFSYIRPADDGDVHRDKRSTGILPVWQTGILPVFVAMTTQGREITNDPLPLRYGGAGEGMRKLFSIRCSLFVVLCPAITSPARVSA